MDSLIGFVFSVLPVAIILIMLLTGIWLAGVSLGRPRILIYPYLAILFWVSGNSYGRLDAVATSIYSRGSGVLYFSLILWLLLAVVLWAQLAGALGRGRKTYCNLLPWFGAWAVLLVGHVFVGSFLEVPLADIIAPHGLSNIVWMVVLILAMLLMFRKPEEVRELSMAIVLVGLARALYGLVRWAAFGGDPANAYANRHGLDLKLTFFDINDNLVCWFALCIALIQLFRPGQSDFSRIWKLILWATVVVCAACIILSFRRTAWLGLLLGGAFLLMQLPARHRLQIMLIGVPPALAGLVYGAWKRLSQTKGAGGLGDFFFDIQSKRIGADSPRLLELKLAWADFIEHPIFGIGSWGRYKGHELISWQTGEYGGTFIHSGVLHIGLKSGLVGLVLMGGLAFAFIHFWRSHKGKIDPAFLPLAIAGVSGVLFMLPDMLIGTPISQIRTMQMMAFCLGLPYVAYGVTHWVERRATAGAAKHGTGIPSGWMGMGDRTTHSFQSIDVR